jgi:hypothetical protein
LNRPLFNDLKNAAPPLWDFGLMGGENANSGSFREQALNIQYRMAADNSGNGIP